MSYQSKHTGTTIDNAITDMQSLQSIILNTVYPVGSLYTSFNSTSPANIIGGTWEQIENCFLMAAGSSYAIGTSGGSATHTHTSAAHTHTTAGHTLTTSEMPSHTHIVRGFNAPSNIAGTTRLELQDDGHLVQYNAGGGSVWYTGKTQGGTAYYRTVTIGTDGYSDYAGGGASHSHGNTGSTTPGATGASSSLPPYKTIYMWQRTA